MKSVDELKDYIETYCGCYKCRAEIAGLIAAIEAEHKMLTHDAVCKAHADGEKNALRQVRSASEDYKRGVEDALDNDELIEERGWIRLPVDADGVTIRLGDAMEGVDKYDTLREVSGEVITIHFNRMDDGSVSTSVGLQVWAKNGKSYHIVYIDPLASIYRHCDKDPEPPVEDVLREFARDFDAWCNYSGPVDESPEDPVAEYAKKLRLAGDAE